MAVWKVRGGDDNEAEDIAIEEGVTAVRFHEIPEDLLDAQTSQEMKQRARTADLGIPPSDIDQLCHFRTSIEIGDLIIMPRKKGSKSWQTLAVGEVTGEYKYRAELPTYRHRREVKWINTAVPKASIDEDLRDFLSAPGTIRKPSAPDAEQRFRAIAESVQNKRYDNVNDSDPRWDKFIRRAHECFDAELLESEEVEYKVVIGRKLEAARYALLSDTNNWSSAVKRGIGGNLIFPIAQAKFRDWIDGSPDDSLNALQALWTRDALSEVERIREFCDLLPRSVSSGPGVRTTVASVLMMGLDAHQYPPFRVTVFNQAYQHTGYGPPDRGADEAMLYQHALDFLDRFIIEASNRRLSLRHRLDAQSLVWQMHSDASSTEPDQPPPEDRQNVEPLPPPMDPWSESNITTLAQELLWQPNHLKEIIDDLQEKRQVIFYGPPGTGKTYVAREIAKQCKLNGGDFEIVQFHPSYSYEDFVQGFRPKLINGQPGFELIDGPLRRIADKARNNPDATFILIIDELNRGNVAKVFGELYFLLEYRDEDVRLQYGGDGRGFSLPSNLWFICTMNTADRSIALMDAALQRRFYFAPFFPEEPPVKGLLHRWLEREGQDTLAADLVDAANKNLERDVGIGPSYFMRDGQTLDERRIRRIWDRAVIPYIEEQFFGDANKLAEFAFDRLKRQLTGPTAMDEVSDQATANDATDTPPENDDTVNPC